MKATILLSLCSAMISGCATEHSALTSSGRDMADEVKAKGLADHYNMTSDVDPSEYDALDRHQRNQSFGKGCRLDFHTLMQATPPQRGGSCAMAVAIVLTLSRSGVLSATQAFVRESMTFLSH